MQALTIGTITHPFYEERYRDWRKWRFVYEGGQRFIENFLEKFSIRETQENFAKRRKMTYNPAFAKEAIDEIKNSIFQRLIDIAREGGSESYQDAVKGLNGGIDLSGSTMNSFIGRKILPELLTMARVGVFVDMPPLDGMSVVENLNKRPYLYVYRAEDIRSWTIDEENHNSNLTNILLREFIYTYDKATGLPVDTKTQYRRLWLADGVVRVQFYNNQGDPKAKIITLNIPQIPFVLVELSDSLLADAANYQIALLNLGSSDMSYALNSNYPFYTEQFDPRADSPFLRKPGNVDGGQSADAQQGKGEEVKVGTTVGRRYPQGMERPGFIHPSAEPLTASMAKQEQLKQEIRQLVNLAVTNLIPRMASAQSKSLDQEGLECGLSYIGLELEQMERKVSEFWSMYEKKTPATVNYPETYDIKSDDVKQKETDRLKELLSKITSKTGAKEILKRMLKVNLSRQLSNETLEKIYNEIDAAKANSADPEVIFQSVQGGYLNLELAADLLGYPKDTVEKASKEHAERLQRIQDSQADSNGLKNPGARGVNDTDKNPAADGKKEKVNSKDTTKDPVVTDKTRGKGQ